jgi:very-short-patch-repair endonuclease
MRFEREDSRPLHTGKVRSLRRRATWTERHFWRELRKLDANFRRQAPIGRYFADFATRHLKLAIEIDGGIHERLPEVAARDIERQRWLERDGYIVVRFTDREVSGDVHACLERVRSHLEAGRRMIEPASEPASVMLAGSGLTPPSPTLPPSRRKGDTP